MLGVPKQTPSNWVRLADKGEQNKAVWPITLSCEALCLTASGYFEHQRRRSSSRPSQPGSGRLGNEALLAHIRAIHAEVKGEYGWPRIWKELLARDFSPAAPNQVWSGDITYIATDEGWLYLAALIDLFSRQVVGWSMQAHMQTSLVTDALRMAWFRRHPIPELIFYSDRGSQYCAHSFQAALTSYGMRSSMSRKGNGWDNAPTESLWGSLKVAGCAARSSPPSPKRWRRGAPTLAPPPHPFVIKRDTSTWSAGDTAVLGPRSLGGA